MAGGILKTTLFLFFYQPAVASNLFGEESPDSKEQCTG